MKRSYLLCIVAVLLSLTDKANANALAEDSYYPELSSHPAVISFQSRLLPRWSFDFAYERVQPSSSVWADAVITAPQVDTLSVYASRQFSTYFSHRVIASLRASEPGDFQPSDLRYLSTDAGVAASLGWQLGDPDSLNMAVEYQYREVGDIDINSLNLGVHYYF